MPKMKTHTGAKRRFRLSGSGKVIRRQAGKAHLNEHKPTKQKRRLSGTTVVGKGQASIIKKLLGK